MAYLGVGNETQALLILQQLQVYEASFPDFPPNFVPPRLFDSNYVLPHRWAAVAFAGLSIGLPPIAIAFVVARLLTRRYHKGGAFGMDDWFIIITLVRYTEALRHMTVFLESTVTNNLYRPGLWDSSSQTSC
jgi:hypothetical protein